MSDVAEAAGAGVASVYRLLRVQARAAGGARDPADGPDRRPPSGRSAARRPLDGADRDAARPRRRAGGEPFVGEARALVAEHPDVIASTARATDALERLLAAARAEGRLRADADHARPAAAVRGHPRRQAGRARALAADAGADDRRARHPALRLSVARRGAADRVRAPPPRPSPRGADREDPRRRAGGVRPAAERHRGRPRRAARRRGARPPRGLRRLPHRHVHRLRRRPVRLRADRARPRGRRDRREGRRRRHAASPPATSS